MTNKRTATAWVYWWKGSSGIEGERVSGFFAALRMTARTNNGNGNDTAMATATTTATAGPSAALLTKFCEQLRSG
jgi:hypothetical protein